jgi:hypothetical protein
MLTMRKTLAMAVTASLALAGDVAYGRDLPPRKPAMEEVTRTSTLSMKEPLGIGDRLKISFYETIDVGGTRQSGRQGGEPQGALRTFYQRMDLSGDYTVEQNGDLNPPPGAISSRGPRTRRSAAGAGGVVRRDYRTNRQCGRQDFSAASGLCGRPGEESRRLQICARHDRPACDRARRRPRSERRACVMRSASPRPRARSKRSSKF